MKVCPRCSFVDTEGRRVCFACRRSLMGTPEMELIEVLELREAALSGTDGVVTKAPWGPGLTALVEQALQESDLSLAAAPPEAPPSPSRAAFDDAAFDDAVFDDAALTEAAHVLTAPSFASGGGGSSLFGDLPPLESAPHVERIAFDDLLSLDDPEAAEVDGGHGNDGVDHDGVGHDGVDLDEREVHAARHAHGDEVEELAEITRQQLAKLYDARLGAPVLLEVDTATNAPRPVVVADPVPKAPPSPNRRRFVLGLVLVVAAFFGVRYVQDGLQGDQSALVQDPTTSVDKLPWRFVSNGPVRINVPTTPQTAPGSAYQRYNLPDLSVSFSVHTPIPSLNSDLSLRTYTIQLASQMGGRFVNGSAYDVSLGTAFTALVQVDGGTTALYVLSTPDALVEVRGDFLGEDQGRANAILERMVRSIEVG